MRFLRSWVWTPLSLAISYVLLMTPDLEPQVPVESGQTAFRWDRDAFWRELERRFAAARGRPCAELAAELTERRRVIEEEIAALVDPQLSEAEFAELREQVFALAPAIAACPQNLTWFSSLQAQLRMALEDRRLADTTEQQRALSYQLSYGSRAVLEAAQLQSKRGEAESLQPGRDEPSATPSVEVRGVRLHSGDLLLSRGGAPTSALIARGNDFPGNFSHVALVAIDQGELSIVEAHIESGVEIASAEAYLADRKLRVMVLRPRASLPALRKDPMLPHRAALSALRRARAEHIPYDFQMDARDESALFCSEVASSAYAALGVTLWSARSRMSDPGLRAWLFSLGVRHFETLAPSDLEYDPAVTVVAEWRNPEALFDAHADNAVIEAMLDNVVEPSPLPYSTSSLPLVRIAKAVSVVMNAFDVPGPVPEGMTAPAAARVQLFTAYHGRIKGQLLDEVRLFEDRQHYRPPYWRLVEMADRLVRATPLPS